MARSIHCPTCNVVLNLPPQAIGRRVKCPKCATRFLPSREDEAGPPSASAVSNSPEGQSDPSIELTKKHSSLELPVLPAAAGHASAGFDLPLLSEPALGSSSASAGAGNGHKSNQPADALALFVDTPPEPRRKRGAEARATHRRCPACGGYVPQGMSLCNTCGLDLDTGVKIDLADDLIPHEAPRPKGIPLTIGVVGGICLALSIALTFAAILGSAQGSSGARYFIPVAGFGIFASTQFLRLKNAKLLLVALAIGAVVDLTAFVAMPVYYANTNVPLDDRATLADDPDVDDKVIPAVEERLDLGQVKTGLVILGLYAALSIFIISPMVQKHFHKK